ncbi:MAG: acylneuraminate cytidylyltransferase family protein [bacterium]|nr:acylneuraminate cytidylyltransferase family protein [bacterium]
MEKNKKKIIVVIPARGGSKGVPRKNIKLLAGKPMISYIIASVKKVKGIDRVIVSTEDKEIAEVAKKFGAEVPFIRPMELATDEVATLPVLQHAVKELKRKEGYSPDYVLLVYPTSPLLKTERIQQAVDLALANDADSVVSGTYDKGHFWVEVEGGYERLYPRKLENRQMSKPLFKENGAIYLTRTNILMRQVVADKLLPLIMDNDENVDIDYPEDFDRAEAILRK